VTRSDHFDPDSPGNRRVRDGVSGNLRLSESTNGQVSDKDGQLAEGRAAAAGVAIDDSPPPQEFEQRHRWLAASTAVTQQLLAGSRAGIRRRE
jgi:two-component system, NarL family, sensor histidine kinase DevS